MSYSNLAKPLQHAWLFLILILGISGCISAQENVTNTPVEPLSGVAAIKTNVMEETKVAPDYTIVPSVTPTATLVATASPTSISNSPTYTLSPTNISVSPIGTPTITPAPTLSVEQEGALLSLLMTDNGDCDLPCWWGVIPGETSEQQAWDMFASQGSDDWIRSFDSPAYAVMGLGYPLPERSDRFRDTIVKFWIENSLIYFITVDGGYRHEDLRAIFVRDWQSYSPAAMLNQNGIPSHIEFTEVENSPYYRLILSYDQLGVEIAYIIPFEPLENGNEKICFVLENVDYIYLALYSPEQASNAPISIIPNRLDNYVSWESTTGLTLTAFQQIFSEASGLPCIIVN